MCGIVGFVDNKPKTKKEKIIKDMADKIAHRGPDAEGFYNDSVVSLGHRRLSIIDLSEKGTQPIYNEDKTKVIVFNGEIYNYKEIKEELLKKGHKFRTETDTEVIIHGYEEYGVKLFSRLRGMFAFVIYDKEKNELVGARDHFGIKPLYYYKDKDQFMFASEIKAFLGHPDFKKEVNKKALKMYLIFQYSVFEETFFKNVYKLKPGHYFIYKNNKLEVKEYFEVDFKKQKKAFNSLKKELQETLEESIKCHQMTSDVEVGSYLSGGVDSSYVVSVAKPDKTFSVGFSEAGFDETTYAKELSDLLNIKNYQDHISSDDFFNALPIVEYHTDEPHANLSTVPLYFLSKLASKQVKVVLSGEGSDEMFAGYNEYNEPTILKIYRYVPLFIRKFIAFIAKQFPHFPGQNTLKLYGKPIEERYIGHGSLFDEKDINKVLADDLKDNSKISDVLKPYYDKVKGRNEITKKMYIDMFFWLPQDILLKADKMTMANSIELRVPLLDKEVFKLAKTIPTKYQIKDKQTKYMFRKIANDSIPEQWAKRRKLGFPVPFSKWIREEKYYKKVKEMFNKEYASEFFNKDYINNLLEEHYTNKKNNGRLIYNIFIFLIWYDKYFIEIS
jgi:asparagine synthase (glutamine-hydrolysing)